MKSTQKGFKFLLFGLLFVVCLGGMAWLVYLNGNFNGLPAPRANAASYDPRQSPDTPAPLPRVTTVAATATPEPTLPATAAPGETATEWNSISPDDENAIRVLLANNNPGVTGKPKTVAALPAQYQPGLFNPLAPPSITFDSFYYFLKAGNSPSLPEALSLYNTCVKLYCDPAVALAFFAHESSMGRAGAAADNKSWGNIRCTLGAACRATNGNGSFKAYTTWTDGLIDWAILLRENYAVKRQLFSLEQIIPHYAPSSDNNDPDGYINTIKKLVTKYRNYHA